MSDILTESELVEWTGYKQPSKQAEKLAKDGIFHAIRRDGSVAVCWHHIHNPKSIEINLEPDYSSLNGA